MIENLQLYRGSSLKRDEVKALLSLSDQADLDLLFEAARAARQKYHGSSIFLYGFLYFSTHCRNNCRFCQYRKDNRKMKRYRKCLPEIVVAAKEMAKTGVHLIDLTMGEDPHFMQSEFQHLIEIVSEVQSVTGLSTMVSPGVLSTPALESLVEAGVEWLACYQETHNRDLYGELRPGQDYELRMRSKVSALSKGLLVEEGILTGVGESLDDLADSILHMRDMGYDQVRSMTFVPQHGSPIESDSSGSTLLEQKLIAVMRLVMPDRLIPASLDIDGLEGLEARLNAGANVVTSIVPPDIGLAGVANNSLDIDESRRTVKRVAGVIKKAGLTVASQDQYENWMNHRRYLK